MQYYQTDHVLVIRVEIVAKLQKLELGIVRLFRFQDNLHLRSLLADK